MRTARGASRACCAAGAKQLWIKQDHQCVEKSSLLPDTNSFSCPHGIHKCTVLPFSNKAGTNVCISTHLYTPLSHSMLGARVQQTHEDLHQVSKRCPSRGAHDSKTRPKTRGQAAQGCSCIYRCTRRQNLPVPSA